MMPVARSPKRNRVHARTFVFLFFALLCARIGIQEALGADEASIPFSIAAGDASVTLLQYSEQSGVAVVYLLDQVHLVRTHPVNGRYTPQEALDTMLRGTALFAVADVKAKTLVIKSKPSLPKGNVREEPHESPGQFDRTQGKSDAAIVKLPAMVTKGDIPSEEQIVPTARPFNSVFDMNEEILDTPRSVTIISSAQLAAIDIQDVRDFSELTSSSYTATNFGAASNPTIRGQYADIFLNGMRERATSNGNGMPIDFNAIESVNIVKGPASAVQGASSYVGGYADLISKRPYFDQFRGSVWETIGSYDTERWGVDVGGPVSEGLAYRISYSGEDSGGFFWSQHAKDESIYAALTWRPSANYELFANVHGYLAEYTDNFGVNRPSQALIDDDLYVTGVNVNNGPNMPPSDPQNSKYVEATGNVMAFGAPVAFDRHMRLENPADGSIARSLDIQAIQYFYIGSNLRIINPNLFSFVRRETYDSYFFDEVINPDANLESRLEIQLKLDRVSFNSGLNGRYTLTHGYNDYMFQPISVWDITKDPSFVNVKDSVYFPGPAELGTGGGPIPGFPGYYANSQLSGGNSNQSFSLDGAIFFQGIWSVTDWLSLVAGTRADYLHVHTIDPYTPGAGAGLSVLLPNENLSVLFKVTPTTTAYATYNFSRNPSGAAGEGGGFDGLTQRPDGTYYLPKFSYSEASELFEVGVKKGTLDNRFFAGLTLYQQTRTAGALNLPETTELVRGVEVELNYQPSRRFYLTFSYSLMAASVPAGSLVDVLGATNAMGQYWAPGIGPSTQETGRIKLQGQPRDQWNGLISYRLGAHWVASINGTLRDEINNNWAGTIVIPWEYSLNGSLAYETRDWTARILVRNMTNAQNWSPPNSAYGNVSIYADPGARGELTITRKF
jgi:outer membrane receptor protein involved in Fe transport